MLHEWLAECAKAIVANPSDTIKGDQAFDIGAFPAEMLDRSRF
jgi:hypothetical protein